jgi:CubicO group peptidase (beta-lactamase class C family)
MKTSEEISAFLSERLADGDFPSAVYLVGEKGQIKFADALGLAVKTNEVQIPAEIETIYDLASLTKPLVTSLLCAKVVERKRVLLDNKIKKFFNKFDSNTRREITIQDLLTHVSGFLAWFPFYLLPDTQISKRKTVLNFIANEVLKSIPLAQVKYSDLNYLMLGFWLEEFYGEFFHEIAKTEIFNKLELKNTYFNPAKELQSRIAACEFGNLYEKNTCQELNFNVKDFAWRDYQIWGEVHDGNAYFLDGIAGHAGLFSTIEDVFKIALQFLRETTTLLKPETCELFKTNFTPDLNEARSFAFELAATENSTASHALAKNSFGHLGFTGTSLWIEPDKERIFILLTNRTHRTLPFININSTRRKFHELAADLLDTE